jgi:serine/threonine protein kinase
MQGDTVMYFMTNKVCHVQITSLPCYCFLSVVLKKLIPTGEFRGTLEAPRTFLQSVISILQADGIVEPEEETWNFVDFIEEMTRLRPSDRMTASELLRHPWLAQE